MPNSTSEQSKEYGKRYRQKIAKERPWYRCWIAINSRCISPSHSYYQRGIKNYLSKEQVKWLWFRDHAGEMIKPTIDRIDTTGNYSVDNCRFIEWEVNRLRKKARPDGKLIQQIDRFGNAIGIFLSGSDVEEKTGVSTSSIHQYLSGKSRHAGGFQWKLVKPTDELRKALSEGRT